MSSNIFIYIGVMALVTYLVRAIPLTLIRREIKSKFIRSFLYYVPYVTLSVMTFPAILSVTGNWISALVGFLAALIVSLAGKGLPVAVIASCASVFLTEIIMRI